MTNTIIMPEDDVQALTLLTSLNDLLTRLGDKNVRKTLENGAAAKFKDASVKLKEANEALASAHALAEKGERELREAEALKETLKEDKLKIENATKEFREMEEEFRSFSNGKTEELLERERVAEATVKDSEKAIAKAEKAAAKSDALTAELEDKLAKLKAAAA